MSIDHYPHIIPNIGEMDKFWEFFGFWAKRYGYVLRCLKEGAEGDKHFTDYELSRRKKVYVSSTFYWGERTFLTDVSTFGAWTSEYADASLIDDVIGQVGEFRLGTVPKQLGCFVDKLHSMLYQYDFYNHEEIAYTHAAKLLLLKLPKEMQASACFKCTGKRSFGTSYAKELREKIRKGNEAEWVRPYSKLLNNFFCPGLSDRILSVLDKNNIEIVELKQKYPQGGEKQLVDAVINRQVPAPPAIPVNVGAIVQNVATAFAVYEAVMKHKPLFERYTTVTGKEMAKPANFLVRMGTPASELIEACGGLPVSENKVLSGGPMMGKALISIDAPIVKGSNSITVISGREAKRHEPGPCLRCAKCVDVCPMGLEPYLLATASSMKMWDKCEEELITSCIECGSCQFTCPAFRPLLDNIRIGKQSVMAIIKGRAKK